MMWNSLDPAAHPSISHDAPNHHVTLQYVKANPSGPIRLHLAYNQKGCQAAGQAAMG